MWLNPVQPMGSTSVQSIPTTKPPPNTSLPSLSHPMTRSECFAVLWRTTAARRDPRTGAACPVCYEPLYPVGEPPSCFQGLQINRVEMEGRGAAPVHHLDAVDARRRSVFQSDFHLVFCEPVVCPSSGPRSLPATIFLWRLPGNGPQVVKHEGLSLGGPCGPGGAGRPGPLGRVRGGGPGPGRPGWGNSARGLCADGHDDGSLYPGCSVAHDARDRRS